MYIDVFIHMIVGITFFHDIIIIEIMIDTIIVIIVLFHFHPNPKKSVHTLFPWSEHLTMLQSLLAFLHGSWQVCLPSALL
jgi:hypothetical protein